MVDEDVQLQDQVDASRRPMRSLARRDICAAAQHLLRLRFNGCRLAYYFHL